MTDNERAALKRYVEFRLVEMIKSVEPHIEYAVRQELYNQSVDIVNDITDVINRSSTRLID